MLRSMFSGVSGLRAHQTMMDVVGNNIANVNTTGYKSTRATFQETLVQTQRGATQPGAAQGGVNAMQLGLGARVASVDGVFSQGATQLTGRATDVAIQGDGFFRVQFNGEEFYTRAGAFSFDANGTLVGPAGELVLDDAGAPIVVDPTAYTDITIGADGVLTGRNAAGLPEALGTVGLATFANPGGLERAGGSLFRASVNSGAAVNSAPGAGTAGVLQSGTLEMSNVDLAQEFTNLIIAQRGFQANSRTITTSDEMLNELVNLKR